jgi:hypothetical protein
VRFEPTPAEQTGAPPSYANPSGEYLPVPGDHSTASGGASRPASVPLATATASPGSQRSAIGGIAIPLGVLVGVGVALLVLVSLLARSLIRAAQTRRVIRSLTPEMAWNRLRDRLRAQGITWRDSTTPRQAAASVEQMIAAREGVSWGAPASEALRELARAVQEARYAPRQAEWPAGELESRIVTVLRVLEVRNRVLVGAGPSAPRSDA